ncbi:MAG: hypothetical protein F9K23_02475 [Bacteroidetes bacterium]|nr:MAG: hypothetical protein F9K23_02475 [Bacteroidota bacterium]
MKNYVILMIAGFAMTACGNEKKPAQSTEQATQQTVTIEPPADIQAKLDEHTCLTCHKPSEKLVGPAFNEVAKKGYTDEQMVSLMYNPKPENWPGYPPMLPQRLPQEDALAIAKWINSLK